jgi:hypothetical protein
MESARPTAVSIGASVIALDTNALLGLYRQHLSSTENLLRNLERIQSQLFLPAEVQREFWLTRDQVLREVRDFTSGQQLADSERMVIAALDAEGRWGIDADAKSELKQLVTTTFQRVKNATRGGSASARARVALDDPTKDVIVSGLSRLFAGRTGAPLSSGQREELGRTAVLRFARQQPPGYRDADKPNGGYGDFFIWTQLIDQALATGLPVIFVTNDVKEDWWRQARRDQPLNARFELVEEMRERAGVGFRLLRFADFLEALGEDPTFDLDESTVDDTGTETARQDTDEAGLIWTAVEFDAMKGRLGDLGYSRQLLVINNAQLSPEGTLSRRQVLSALELPAKAKLTAFTRPIRRLQQAMTDDGELRAGLPWALNAEYDGPGKAQRFSVPIEVSGASTAQ